MRLPTRGLRSASPQQQPQIRYKDDKAKSCLTNAPILLPIYLIFLSYFSYNLHLLLNLMYHFKGKDRKRESPGELKIYKYQGIQQRATHFTNHSYVKKDRSRTAKIRCPAPAFYSLFIDIRVTRGACRSLFTVLTSVQTVRSHLQVTQTPVRLSRLRRS